MVPPDGKLGSGATERRIRSRLRDIDTMPFIFRKLLIVINKPYPSAREIGEVIAADSSLSLRILRMVNSAAMAPRQPVISVSQAVRLLGINTVRSVTVCLISYDSFFSGIDEERRALWLHSLACGFIARNLAKIVPGLDCEEMFVAGMLHDVGLSVLAKHFPLDFRSLHRAYKKTAHPFQAELKLLGVTHAQIGYWACLFWKLSETLAQAVLHHHEPLQAGDYQKGACLVHLADCLALQALRPGHPEIPYFQPDCLRILGLNSVVVSAVLQESAHQWQEVEQFVSGQTENLKESESPT